LATAAASGVVPKTEHVSGVNDAAVEAASPGIGTLNIRQYLVTGSKRLSAAEVGEAVYPFMGPARTEQDVEGARAALEALYRENGFQTVTVEVPQQDGRRGVIFLKVVENKVGRLRVKGSRYFSLSEIKRRAPSLAEGSLPNFNEIEREIVALNQWPDRRITPTLRPGVEPGTVDIDLEVKDTFPLHGSIELNNRYSPDTTPLRVNGSISYGNLWQAGHSVGFSFQVAPERQEDAKIFSAYYLARFATVPWLSLILQGTKQDSNVSTLGGAAVAGRGEILGGRAMITLPERKNFYHSLSFGLDYKKFDENVLFGLAETKSPITYYPWTLGYNATWASKGRITDLNAGVTFHIRGTGSSPSNFDNKRFGADGSFFYFRGDLSHTHDLKNGIQLYGKVQGQASGRPLLNSEQYSGGGLETARGYLESVALGDNALFGTIEVRSPSLSEWWWKDSKNEWRVYAFVDAGFLTLNDAPPEQTSRFELASYGVGSRIRLFDYINGSVDAGVPLISQGTTSVNEVLVTFRLWGEF